MIETIFGDTWEIMKVLLVDYYLWVLFVWVILWIGYKLWLERQNIKFLSTVKWVFLEVRVDELNEKSPVAMEQVFASMHAMFQSFSLGEKWSGRLALHMSAEIVSIGGRISYVFKLPERYRNLLESAIFAQYPKAEIREIQDYLGNLPRTYDPEKSEFEMWGTQLIKRAHASFPIRTYRDLTSFFEHTEQKSIVDPLAGVLEVMSNVLPHELLSYQIVMKPTTEDWKKGGWDEVNKLKGVPPKAAPPGWFDTIFLKAPAAAFDMLFNAVGLGSEAEPKKEEKPQALTATMTDSEKHRVDSIVGGLGKLGFEVKIRVLYLAPKDKFSKSLRIPELLGAFRNFNNPLSNDLRPEIKITTDASFKLSQAMEKPWLDHKILVRKNRFLRWFKDRAHWEGSGWTVLNTEELATLYHFPQAPNVRVSQIERVHTVKSAPPMDLPIG